MNERTSTYVEFEAEANKDGLHAYDWERFFEMCIAAHLGTEPVDVLQLGQWLAEDDFDAANVKDLVLTFESLRSFMHYTALGPQQLNRPRGRSSG